MKTNTSWPVRYRNYWCRFFPGKSNRTWRITFSVGCILVETHAYT